MIQSERIKALNDRPVRTKGAYVVYWMQHAQRAEWNHAVEVAIREANRLGLPLLAVFGLVKRFLRANQRHYAFLLEGLVETASRLLERGVRLAVLPMPPSEAALTVAGDAAMVVTDRGYLRPHRAWRRRVAERSPCRLLQVETDVVVPVETASNKSEYAARTLRPKIHREWERYLVPLSEVTLERDLLRPTLDLPTIDPGTAHRQMDDLQIPTAPRDGPAAAAIRAFKGGSAAAHERLDRFVRVKLSHYADERNDPTAHAVSDLSPYLHFGQISPLEVAIRIRDADSSASVDAFLEELVVRRELAINHCYYSADYDTYACVPEWCRETLTKHCGDPRPYTYTYHQLVNAQTHDPYWNAAQREMLATGKMHGYMRMYWGKKILEWVADPAEAFAITIEMNDRYELDGRDPNGYTGVAWCFGRHDRPWSERPIYGTVRTMTASGLERKLDIEAYVRYVDTVAGGDTPA